MSIFISIASYRDDELPRTIASAVENASDPTNLHIGVVQQSTKSERLDLSTNSHVSEIWVPAQNARGAGYARALAQEIWNGEDWFLQIDSHTRFDKNWDLKLIAMYEAAVQQAGTDKVILSQFPKAYIRDGNEDLYVSSHKYPDQPMTQIAYFHQDSMWSALRQPFNDPLWRVPEESEVILAGLVFAPGSIVSEVPYDPDICFWGEELCFSIRAWTRGWKIYSPNEQVVAHFYERKGHHKVWDRSNDAGSKWKAIEHDSILRQHKVYTGEILGTWGAPNKQSLYDYFDFVMQDIAAVYTKHLQQQQLIYNTHTETDIFDMNIMPMVSHYCSMNKHGECEVNGCECGCHGT